MAIPELPNTALEVVHWPARAMSRDSTFVAAMLATLLTAVAPTLGLGAQSASASTSALPPVPTTHVLAIGHVTDKWTPSARATVMPQEVRETVRLYLGGKIGEWFVRQDQPGVVFLMNVTTGKEAKELLDALPLGTAHLMEFDLIPLGPLSPLAMLLAPPAPSSRDIDDASSVRARR